ncbi:hypothetical protein EFA46_016100 (plasmid) [Halarchaeum sp. CBA1220]|uniref:hypothetical protein n=1 Tax=Halarchaeum sp. CBA1220 TaxID=1853682 RepID=UPI0015A4007D|nr:hypothetical protein [Halarchaeum sp. CBA1220]QLC35779.1 hypothetical protein EFA46_016100 [Halarchaeum sp. CBA1220]
MDVFDTNIWVFGITETAPEPVRLVEEAESGDRRVVLDAYIFEEVREAFGRSKSVPDSDVEATVENFATRVVNSPYIDGPSTEEVRQMDLGLVRESPETNLLGDAIGIQAKDVPILRLAYEWRHRDPTIYTNDRSFSQFDPSAYNLPEISMEYVPQ